MTFTQNTDFTIISINNTVLNVFTQNADFTIIQLQNQWMINHKYKFHYNIVQNDFHPKYRFLKN